MKPCRHNDHVPKCPVCELALRFPDRWAGELPSNKLLAHAGYIPNISVDNAPCKFRGELVPLPDRYKLGLGVIKEWYPCGKGLGENGYVCPCMGCNSNCPEYARVETCLTE